jgi:hypothetical protein
LHDIYIYSRTLGAEKQDSKNYSNSSFRLPICLYLSISGIRLRLICLETVCRYILSYLAGIETETYFMKHDLFIERISYDVVNTGKRLSHRPYARPLKYRLKAKEILLLPAPPKRLFLPWPEQNITIKSLVFKRKYRCFVIIQFKGHIKCISLEGPTNSLWRLIFNTRFEKRRDIRRPKITIIVLS